MAPSVGHLHKLVAKNAKLVKYAWQQVQRTVQDSVRVAHAELQPVLARNSARQPRHPLAVIKQSKRKWYSTQNAFGTRQFSTRGYGSSGASKYTVNKAAFSKTSVGSAVGRLTGRVPFACTLRPNLTGGTLNRTAGGYAFGAGNSARYFSHSPTAPAQVLQNVSQAMRAFFISGQKAQFDGIDPRSGEKRYKAVTALQEETGRKVRSLPRTTPGSYVNFGINPTITAVTSMTSVTGFPSTTTTTAKNTLNTEGLLDVLSVDFSRALKDLAAVLNDLKQLSSLGDLPISYEDNSLRVHFPGCDASTVEKLCAELAISRGIVIQDSEFDAYVGTEIALLFPFAPSDGDTFSECSFYNNNDNHNHNNIYDNDFLLYGSSSPAPPPPPPTRYHQFNPDQIEWQHMMSPTSFQSEDGHNQRLARSDVSNTDPSSILHVDGNGWLMHSPSAYESLRSSEIEEAPPRSYRHEPLEYQGIEGIYRFIEQCDAAASLR